MKHVSILGCGWLGFPLAKSLVAKGFSVSGSTTSFEKISALENQGIQSFLIELFEEKINGDIASFLQETDVLIVDIPPKLRSTSSENFVAKIETLLAQIEKSQVKKVIFISSISVYADDNSVITEETIPNPETESGKQLLQAEQLLQQNQYFQTTVIRFGGLIGTNRHPVFHLAGKQNLQNPKAPVNLIELQDCIGIIEAVISKNCFSETFNAVTPFHPSRKDYYTQKATAFGLPLPEFDDSKQSVGKTIISTKITTVLDYHFQNQTL